MEAQDHRIVLRYGEDVNQCDYLGAREALIFREMDVYHLFHDGTPPKGCLAWLDLLLSVTE